MNKHNCCVLAGLVAFGTNALAQSSVQLYGIVDAGVMHWDRGGGQKSWAVQSGIGSGSRWGLRGTEDLGGGLRASFVLEGGFDLDTGAAKSYAGNPSTATPPAPTGVAGIGFNRRSSVSIEGPWGSLTLGRDYTPFFWAGLRTDILNYGYLGNLQSIASLTGGSERLARASNGVFYLSPDLSGLKLRAMYSLGSESAGGPGALPSSANHLAGAGAEYTAGKLLLTASYQALKLPDVAGTPPAFTGSNSNVTSTMLSGRYDTGTFAVSGGWWRANSAWSSSDVWIGASWTSGAGTLFAQMQHIGQDNPTGAKKRANIYGLTYTYSVSKRTLLYATAGTTQNNATGSIALFTADFPVTAAAPGANPTATALGIRHTF